MKNYLNIQDFKNYLSMYFDSEKNKTFIDFKTDKVISELLTEKLFEDTKNSFINNLDESFIIKYLYPINDYIYTYKEKMLNINKFNYHKKNDIHQIFLSKENNDFIFAINFPSFKNIKDSSFEIQLKYKIITKNPKNDESPLIFFKNISLDRYRIDDKQFIGYEIFAYDNNLDKLRDENSLIYKNDINYKKTVHFLNLYISECFNSYNNDFCIKNSINEDFYEIDHFIKKSYFLFEHIKTNPLYEKIFSFMSEKEFNFKDLKEDDLELLKLSFDYNLNKDLFENSIIENKKSNKNTIK